jgi:hypothetical protein
MALYLIKQLSTTPRRRVKELQYSFTINDLSTRWRGVVSFTPPAALSPGIEPQVPIVDEAGWVPVAIWTVWRSGKPLAPVGNRTPARSPSCSN